MMKSKKYLSLMLSVLMTGCSQKQPETVNDNASLLCDKFEIDSSWSMNQVANSFGEIVDVQTHSIDNWKGSGTQASHVIYYYDWGNLSLVSESKSSKSRLEAVNIQNPPWPLELNFIFGKSIEELGLEKTITSKNESKAIIQCSINTESTILLDLKNKKVSGLKFYRAVELND